MNIKYDKLLLVASVVNTLLGLFYMICGILEFVNVLNTAAHHNLETIGVQLSYLVFVSSIITTATGVLSLIFHKSLKLINLRVFMGAAALAWPLFLTITLFFTQMSINIRLITMTLTLIFFVIAILIVKITNAESTKGIKFNPSAIIAASGKRGKSVNLNAMIGANAEKIQTKNVMQSVGNLAQTINKKSVSFKGSRRLFAGKRKVGKGNALRGIYGKKRRNTNVLASMFGGRRRRRR